MSPSQTRPSTIASPRQSSWKPTSSAAATTSVTFATTLLTASTKSSTGARLARRAIPLASSCLHSWCATAPCQHCIGKTGCATSSGTCSTLTCRAQSNPRGRKAVQLSSRDTGGFQSGTTARKAMSEMAHEHLGNEHAECWAHSMANDSAGSIDEEKDSDTDGANSKMDEDTEEEKGDADVSMDENDEVEKGTHEQEPPNLKAFSVWGCDESASEDWDRDYENSSQGYDSDELKEGEDEGEEEGGDVVSELVSMALVDVEGPHIGGTDTGSEAERYQYAW
ncbi:hypothetical protein BC567DRAFT_232387 [Phyllosticta citribraziliensis]